MAAFAHNVLKLVRRLAKGQGPPCPESPAVAAALGPDPPLVDAVARCSHPSSRLFPFTGWGSDSAPAFR